MECPVRRCYKLLRNTKHTLAESQKSHISLTIVRQISLNDCDGFVTLSINADHGMIILRSDPPHDTLWFAKTS